MRKEVEHWWKQAEEDFESAKLNLKIKRYYLVVFLCQQAVEKGLKAYYFKSKNTNPGPTHSLIYLATETRVPNRFYKFLKKLTPQFVNTRYPDAAYGTPSDLYDEEIASEYIKEAEELIKWLRSQMTK